ncbi:MAG: YihY/virulence factor BrkB family protein [Bacteroidales bacterium]|jgi:membrane protein|nr:YihY/virulence factor BrkB family protein [Bacteroidales bacterium]MCI2121162.1 YihY/virulence factor BrkB family protein [Bacteroidales bacterium]MCI2144751.1 YihY/virulence factor BrkB family protein [Bacteroidales bacterium]
MANIKTKALNTYERIFKFLTHDLWVGDFSEVKKSTQRLFLYLKIAIITMRNFSSHRIGREAAALSYSCLMAIVPMVAMILWISNGFGLDIALADLLYNSFPTSHQLIDAILRIANNIINTTQKGLFGWISFGTFLWLVIWVLICIEGAFNKIWNVRKYRAIWKRALVILGIIFLSPFILLLFLYGGMYFTKNLGNLVGSDLPIFRFLKSNLYWVVFYIIIVLVFMLMYKLIPNAEVKWKPAFDSALVSGLVFLILQFLYLKTQLLVSKTNSIYGAFAALPLAMVWLSYCWQIILFGSELSYAYQHVDTYDKYSTLLPQINRKSKKKEKSNEH